VTALELLNASMSIDIREGQLALNIDILKTFDCISWTFLFEVLRSFEFFESFIGWVSNIFDSVTILALIDALLRGILGVSEV